MLNGSKFKQNIEAKYNHHGRNDGVFLEQQKLILYLFNDDKPHLNKTNIIQLV